jgi:drug/metabolite transporter (DMT)-like permease
MIKTFYLYSKNIPLSQIYKMLQSHIGEFAALLVAICWSFSALAFESASKAVGSLVVNYWRLIFAMVFLSVFSFFYRGLPFPTDATSYQWFWLSLSGLVGFVIGDLCLFKSFVIIGSRFAMLIMTLAPAMAAAAGWFILGEHLSWYSILGIFLTIFGIGMAVISHNPEQERLKLNIPLKGFLFAFGGAVGQAFGLVLSKKGMAGYDSFAATQIRIITGMIGFAAIIIISGRSTQTLQAFKNRIGMKGITIGSFFGPFLGVSLSLFSLKHTSTGISATIMATTPILIIPLAIVFLKQKITVKEMVGAIISVIGVALFFI